MPQPAAPHKDPKRLHETQRSSLQQCRQLAFMLVRLVALRRPRIAPTLRQATAEETSGTRPPTCRTEFSSSRVRIEVRLLDADGRMKPSSYYGRRHGGTLQIYATGLRQKALPDRSVQRTQGRFAGGSYSAGRSCDGP
ncbi:protein of unknown function [Cupriavidus neocaledonicus]|uniref:Uncharacterized protein n=1 Tax=Cupriavidus neocaledonicus TaxID=1040979 RepID=A0A375H933_9BURK|nr:protein of unknown function [Cupriavidus neocaledonicus]